MELIDRYLHAVKGYLPEAQQNDIVAELKDDLLSQIEEREAALERPLNDAELQALLKQSGHPMLVASRYRPQEHLIGPTMYPFWWTAQKFMLIVVGSVYGLLVGIRVLSSGFSVSHLIQELIQSAFGFVSTALFYAAAITLVFWFFERNQVRFGFLDQWNPTKLAPATDRLRIKRDESIFEVVFEALFLLWWIGVISFATTFYHHGKPVPFSMSPAWEPYWWPILATSVASMALAVVNLITPYWTRQRLLFRIGLNIVCIGLAYLLFQQDELIVVGDATLEMAKFGNAQTLLNKSAHVVLVLVSLMMAAEIVGDVRKLFALANHGNTRAGAAA
ncbi:MAG: hypothetical protein ACKO1K_07840 [Burkholderiales bacterium]